MTSTTRGLFTVIVDYEGGTYISQVKATDVTAALLTWCDLFKLGEGVPKTMHRLPAAVRKRLTAESDRAVPLNGLAAVWCFSLNYRSKLVILNIVRTAET